MKLILVLIGLVALVAADGGFHRNGRGGHNNGRSLSNRRGRQQPVTSARLGQRRPGRRNNNRGSNSRRRGRQEEAVGGYEAPAADAYGAPPQERVLIHLVNRIKLTLLPLIYS